MTQKGNREQLEKAIEGNEDIDDDEDQCAGEYIFVVDRSGSMSGNPMEMTKSALKLFMQSLPANSKFNIVSFGTRIEFAYSKSQTYDNKSMKDALKKIEQFSADLGGTDIYSPLD